MIYFFTILTVIFTTMLLGDKSERIDSKYSGALIASILATAAVCIWG